MLPFRLIRRRPFCLPYFLSLPLSAQALFFHMILRANGNGVIHTHNATMGLKGISQDDLRALVKKDYIEIWNKDEIHILYWYDLVPPEKEVTPDL